MKIVRKKRMELPVNTRAQELLDQINATLKGPVLKMGSDKTLLVEYWPTGILPMDMLLQGGIPKGRFVEIVGDYSTLKSYIGLKAIATTQASGGVCALIDTEHSYDPTWAAALGIDTKALIVQQPETGELAMDTAEALIRGECDLIVFDSIAATLPQTERNKRLHEESVQPARQAQLMSLAMRKLTAANSKTAMVWINQTRLNVGVTFGNPESLPGGRAMPYYACLAPGTKILRSDYQWVAVETLTVGDSVVGFDEYVPAGQHGRKMHRSVVEANDPVDLPCIELTTDRGVTVASEAHMWLVKEGYSYKPTYVWKMTKDLSSSDEIMWFGEPWSQDYSYDAAYLSGLFDGEGSVNTEMWTRNGTYRGWNVTLAQKPGLVLNKAKQCLDDLGFDYREDLDKRSGCHKITLRGTLYDRMRFMGMVNPERLTSKIGSGWDGASAFQQGCAGRSGIAVVKELRSVGTQTVYAIGTSTKTLIADGMFSHNSYRINMKKVGKVTTDVQSWDGEKMVTVKEQIGQKFKAIVEKSKLSKPFRDVYFTWDYQTGEIDEVGYLIALGLEAGLITQKGAMWEYNGTTWRGKAKFKEAVMTDPDLQTQIKAAVIPLGFPGNQEAPKKKEGKPRKVRSSVTE